MLGLMYYGGTGVAKDYKRAYAWYSIAAENGDDGAIESRDGVAEELSIEDLLEAQALAAKLSEEIKADN
jgi:TPR repeat protein